MVRASTSSQVLRVESHQLIGRLEQQHFIVARLREVGGDEGALESTAHDHESWQVYQRISWRRDASSDGDGEREQYERAWL